MEMLFLSFHLNGKAFLVFQLQILNFFFIFRKWRFLFFSSRQQSEASGENFDVSKHKAFKTMSLLRERREREKFHVSRTKVRKILVFYLVNGKNSTEFRRNTVMVSRF